MPPVILQLDSLRVLSLNANHLERFPGELAAMPQLTNLNLSGNRLRELSATIGQFTNLRSLTS